MIVGLTGRVLSLHDDHCILFVQGIHYGVEMHARDLAELTTQHHEVVLHTAAIYREDDQLLFGFLHIRERDLFKRLIKISGVGPKVAMAILGSMSVDDLLNAALHQDANAFKATKGVGKKMAERLLVELKGLAEQVPVTLVANGDQHDRQDVLSVLLKLGYHQKQAMQVLSSIEDSDTETMIRQALQQLTP
ncbi:MAG: Holliday junction branch migration protein RuvA [Candidatus Comchoanobacterales bacterium]